MSEARGAGVRDYESEQEAAKMATDETEERKRVKSAGAPPQRSIAEVDPQTTALVDVILEKHPRIAERGRAFKELVSRGVDRREARELATGAIPDDDDRPPTEMPLLMASGDDGLIPPAIVPGLLWAGYVSLIDAAAKTGKTTLIADALGAVLTGRPWLGEDTDPPDGPILYFSEMPLDLLRAWLRRHDVPVDAPIRGDKMQSVDIIRERIDHYKPAAVIVDSLLDLNASTGNGNMWHPGDVRTLIKGIRDAGAAALIVHHVRKSDGETADSRDVTAAVDMIVHFDIGRKYGKEPPAGHTPRRLSYVGRWTEQIRQLEYDTAAGRYRLQAGSGPEHSGGGSVPGDGLDRQREYCRDWIERNPAGPANQFVKDMQATGDSKSRRVLLELFRDTKESAG